MTYWKGNEKVKGMAIMVQVFGAAQLNAGFKKKQYLLPSPSTVEDLLSLMVQSNPSLAALLEGREHSISCLILVGGSDIKKLQGVTTTLKDGDTVDIISMISGG